MHKPLRIFRAGWRAKRVNSMTPLSRGNVLLFGSIEGWNAKGGFDAHGCASKPAVPEKGKRGAQATRMAHLIHSSCRRVQGEAGFKVDGS